MKKSEQTSAIEMQMSTNTLIHTPTTHEEVRGRADICHRDEASCRCLQIPSYTYPWRSQSRHLPQWWRCPLAESWISSPYSASSPPTIDVVQKWGIHCRNLIPHDELNDSLLNLFPYKDWRIPCRISFPGRIWMIPCKIWFPAKIEGFYAEFNSPPEFEWFFSGILFPTRISMNQWNAVSSQRGYF